ncbi:MAG: tyrosine recombinase XerC [Peptoniphilaceae bacterium]
MINTNLIDDFISYLSTSKGFSKTTVKEYYYDLRTFFKFILIRKSIVDINSLEEDINIDLVTLEVIKGIDKRDIYSYISYLDKSRKNSNRTKYRKISSIRTFFNYLSNKIDLIKYNPAKDVDMPKIEKSLPVHLSLDESINLLNTILESDSKELYIKRDYCIVTLFLNCGLRLSELSNLNIGDIKENNTVIVKGKGSKQRTIYLNKASLNSIKEYLKLRQESIDDALFLSNRKTRLSNRQIQRMVEKYIKKSGLNPNKYTVHKLRHTAATLMYKYGDGDLRSLQEILGHESVTTTQIYTHIDNESLRKTVEDNPLSDI